MGIGRAQPRTKQPLGVQYRLCVLLTNRKYIVLNRATADRGKYQAGIQVYWKPPLTPNWVASSSPPATKPWLLVG